MKSNRDATAINVGDQSTKSPSTTTKATQHPQARIKKGLAIFDFILRLLALAAALAATATMGTTDQTLPFFTQFFQFQASYDDLPAFTYVVLVIIYLNYYRSSYMYLFNHISFFLSIYL